MFDKTRWDIIRNDDNRKSVRVTPTIEKMVEIRLRWFGHVKRNRFCSKDCQTTRGRWTPRKTIRETINKDFEIN